MTASEQMLALVEGSKNLRRLCREYETESVTVHLKELVGGAFSLYAAATIRRTGGVHVFVAEDRDAAAYLLNDLYALLDERRILFFPSSYKRSIVYGAEDAQGVVQRTAALNALRTPPAGYLALCTYPEALAERVVDAEALRRETMTVRAGDRLRPADLVEWLDESGFVRVDFVYEPGQYSQRGGIVDVFSYVESLPYRFDFSTRRSTRSGGSTFRASCRRTSCSRPRSFPTSMRAKADGCRSSKRRATCAIGFSMRITPCGAWTICGGGCSPRRTIPPAWTVR